jgi:hypothetical protein
MTASSALPSIYQLQVALCGISPLIWRRLLVRSDTTLAHFHAILQIMFAWSDKHLHCFHIHGQEYGTSGAQACHGLLSDLQPHCDERFRYVYDFIAHWACDIRIETLLPWVPRRVYPVCVGGKYAAPPEDGRGALAYMERLDQHRLYPPLEAIGIVAEAISTLLEADPRTAVRAALGDLEDLREAVDCLDTYQQFQPEYFNRHEINAQLQSRRWYREETP